MSDDKNFYIALFLSVPPLGLFGLHHFYLERKVRAIIYALLFFTLLPGIFALADALIMIYRGKESFLEKHGNDEDLEEYHLRQLYEQNPILAQQVEQQLDEYDKEELKDLRESDNTTDNVDDNDEGSDDSDDKIDESEYNSGW